MGGSAATGSGDKMLARGRDPRSAAYDPAAETRYTLNRNVSRAHKELLGSGFRFDCADCVPVAAGFGRDSACGENVRRRPIGALLHTTVRAAMDSPLIRSNINRPFSERREKFAFVRRNPDGSRNGIPTVAASTVVLVTDRNVCTKAERAYSATLKNNGVTPSGAVYVLKIGTVYVVKDPVQTATGWSLEVVLDNQYRVKAKLLG